MQGLVLKQNKPDGDFQSVIPDYLEGYNRDAKHLANAFMGGKTPATPYGKVQQAVSTGLAYAVNPFYRAWLKLPISNENKPYKTKSPRFMGDVGTGGSTDSSITSSSEISMSSKEAKKALKNKIKKDVARAARKASRQTGKKLTPGQYKAWVRSQAKMARERHSEFKMSGKKQESLLRKVTAPPTTYQGSYNAGPKIGFSTSKQGNLIANVRIKLADVQLQYDGASAIPKTCMIVTSNSFAANIKGSMYLGGVEEYTPDPMFTFMTLFNEYRYLQACYEFTPRVKGGTTSNVSLTWCFNSDPCYPETHGIDTDGSGINFGFLPTEDQIGQMDGAIQYSAWVPDSCFDATPQLDKKWRYISGSDFNDAISLSDSSAVQRQTYAGVLLVSGDKNLQEDLVEINQTIGQMYFTFRIELKGFGPPINNNITFMQSLRCLRRLDKNLADEVQARLAPKLGHLLVPKYDTGSRKKAILKMLREAHGLENEEGKTEGELALGQPKVDPKSRSRSKTPSSH